MKAILESQVQAACTLFNAVPAYTATEMALRSMAERLKEDDHESCLLKTVAVNFLLGTNLYDVLGMAKHVHEVLKANVSGTDPDLVDRLAKFKEKSHMSSASKYAHFFLDSKRFPIYDQYVCRSIAYHRESKRIWPTTYVEFAKWFEEVRVRCEFQFSTKEIDRYLWLFGMCRVWLTSEEPGLGKDAIALFEREEPEIKSALAALLGDQTLTLVPLPRRGEEFTQVGAET